MRQLINVVYSRMTPARIDVDSSALPYDVVWTDRELSGSDCVVYLSGYSFNRRRARGNPAAFRVLYLCEPLSVYPIHFLRGFWKPFDAVFTCNDMLFTAGGRMHHLPIISYDYPFAAGHGVIRPDDEPLPDPANRLKALCQIVGDKYSPIVGQLYSLRRAAARWFHAHGRIDMDVYGHPAMNVPNYKGAVDSKLETMRKYRYALCFENLYHPLWSRGYLTEKLFDCMVADCIPVYYGCANVEEMVPENCFIDFRKFGDFQALDTFLSELTDQDYLAYVRNIRAFLDDFNAPRRCSAFRLYEKAGELARQPAVASDWPPGFWQTASLREKAAYLLMVCGLKGYRFIHPFFNLLRRGQS